jgi:hypothetical protein
VRDRPTCKKLSDGRQETRQRVKKERNNIFVLFVHLNRVPSPQIVAHLYAKKRNSSSPLSEGAGAAEESADPVIIGTKGVRLPLLDHHLHFIPSTLPKVPLIWIPSRSFLRNFFCVVHETPRGGTSLKQIRRGEKKSNNNIKKTVWLTSSATNEEAPLKGEKYTPFPLSRKDHICCLFPPFHHFPLENHPPPLLIFLTTSNCDECRRCCGSCFFFFFGLFLQFSAKNQTTKF